jgi:hypothetical protein
MMRSLGVVLAVVVLACFAATSARADTPPNIFAGAGVFVDNEGNFPGPWALADELDRDGFSWIALKAMDGWITDDVDQTWIDVFHAHGIAVGGWGALETHPLIDAVLANLQIQKYGFDFYIADAERSYESTQRGGWRSANFVSVFRQLQPTLPAALVTFGAAPAPYVLPIDYASWRNAGFQLLPEAYYNQFPVYRPDLTVQHALRAGWTADQVHPVIGVYHHYPAANYVPLLENDGARGFSVFLADQTTSADFQALAPLAHAASGR